MSFTNSYEDTLRAESYASLEFPNTYYLAYRDLPEIIKTHTRGSKAIDFGCGAGRSTRFLSKLGFETIGIDISEDMIKKAYDIDPEGDYRLVKDGHYAQLGVGAFDLVLSVFTFDNIPLKRRALLLERLSELLNKTGKLVLLDSTPELYLNEWASFSLKDFPENQNPKDGDIVKVIMNDVPDKRPVEDVFCSLEGFQNIFRKAGLKLIASYKPLAKAEEPFEWINETRIAPWIIYVLEPLVLKIDKGEI